MFQAQARDKTKFEDFDSLMLQAQYDPSCKGLYLLMMKRGAYDATRAEIHSLFRVCVEYEGSETLSGSGTLTAHSTRLPHHLPWLGGDAN